MLRALYAWITVLSFSLEAVSAATQVQRRDVDSASITADNFLRRRFHSITLAGKYLYMDGGQVSYTDGDNKRITIENATLSIDMTKDWDNASVTLTQISRPSDLPKVNLGALWYHQSEDLIYAAPAGDQSVFDKSKAGYPALSLWALKPDGKGGGSWSQKVNPTSSEWQGIQRPTRAQIAQSPDSGFVLNGQNAMNAYVSGMIQVDMGGSNNITRLSTLPTFARPLQLGALQYVPTWGKKGILVAFPGQQPDIGFPSGATLSVYDIAANEWFNQTTSGTRPIPRIDHCVAGLQSMNNTFEIMLYGGTSGYGKEQIARDEIFILTLPAFYWTKVAYKAAAPRIGHTCTPVGGSQILVVGGGDPSIDSTKANDPVDDNKLTIYKQDQNTMTSADPFKQGLGIFDLQTLTWKDGYSASGGSYQQAGVIAEYYKNNSAAREYEQNYDAKWAALVANQSTSKPTTSTGSANTDPSQSTSSKSQPNVGAIAGGTVGGIAFLALLALLALYLYRRHRKSQPSPHSEPGEKSGYPDRKSIQEAGSRETIPEIAGHDRHEMAGQPGVLGNSPYVYEMGAEGPSGGGGGWQRSELVGDGAHELDRKPLPSPR